MAEEVKKPGDPAESQVLDQPIEAAAEVAETLEDNDEGTPADKTVIEEAHADESKAIATPAAEAAPVEVSEEVAAAGVTSHHEGEHAAHAVSENQGNIQATGEHHPVHAVDGSQVALPGQEKQKEIFPPVMDSGEFGKGESLPLHKLAWQRAKLLLFGRGLRDPLDAQETNVTQMPQATNQVQPAPAQEVKKAA